MGLFFPAGKSPHFSVTELVMRLARSEPWVRHQRRQQKTPNFEKKMGITPELSDKKKRIAPYKALSQPLNATSKRYITPI